MCIRLIVGLGNPGESYRDTRHNIGFDVIDRLTRSTRVVETETRREFERTDVEVGALRVHLLKPLTFMNVSGVAVAQAAADLALGPQQVAVVYDCLDLSFGRLRIRRNGSSGGHRGVQSIIDELETDRFARLRIGIGRPQGTAIEHVLSSWDNDEATALKTVLATAEDAVRSLIRDGAEAAMNAYNGWVYDAESSDRDANEKEK